MFDRNNSNSVLDGRENLHAMRWLWCGVIQLAWDDVFCETKATSAEILGKIADIRHGAARWFGTSDFREVCALAGVDDAAVLDAFKRKMRGFR